MAIMTGLDGTVLRSTSSIVRFPQWAVSAFWNMNLNI